MLIRASCDVLIVLDCCFAGSAGRSNVKGTKELLAACGMEATAEGVSDYSFTRNLIDKLRSFGTDPFTVSELYERLVKAKRRLRNTPQYIPLTGRDRSSIRIARLRSNSPVIMNNSILSLPSSSSSSNNFPLSSASNSLTSSSTSLNINRRVLLAVSLETDSPLPEVESWKRWLASDAPTYIQRIDVRIEDAYPSNSTLVLVSMPISVWCHLPDTTAYRFVSFITGGSIFKIASYSPDLENAILQNFPDPDSISQSKTASYALPLSSIDRKPMHLQMARMCIQFLSINLKADICKLRSPAFLRRNMGAQKLLEYVSKEAQYACRYWSEHLEVGQGSISDGDDVHTFLLQHFLHWLEAMSWTGLSSECVHIIYRLQSLLKVSLRCKLVNKPTNHAPLARSECKFIELLIRCIAFHHDQSDCDGNSSLANLLCGSYFCTSGEHSSKYIHPSCAPIDCRAPQYSEKLGSLFTNTRRQLRLISFSYLRSKWQADCVRNTR